jgi:hypothetical protein
MSGAGGDRKAICRPLHATHAEKGTEGRRSGGDRMKSLRPVLLTVLCFGGFVGCFLNVILVISPPVQKFGGLYSSYLSLSTIFVIFCLSGLWMMKKWAVVAYSFYMVINQLVYIWMGNWNWFAFALPVAITLVGWFYYRKME